MKETIYSESSMVQKKSMKIDEITTIQASKIHSSHTN